MRCCQKKLVFEAKLPGYQTYDISKLICFFWVGMCVKSVKKADTFYLKFPEIHPYWLEEMRCCQEGERGAKWRVSNYTPSLLNIYKTLKNLTTYRRLFLEFEQSHWDEWYVIWFVIMCRWSISALGIGLWPTPPKPAWYGRNLCLASIWQIISTLEERHPVSDRGTGVPWISRL